MPINLSEIESENFCIAPWVNLHINQKGMLKPCCGGNSDVLNFGHIQNDDWSYIDGTNRALESLKQSLLDGEQPAYCRGCFEKGWYDEFRQDEIIIDNVNEFVLKSFDVRWGTTCQLSCTYCDHGNSTTWANLEHKKNKIIPIHPPRTYRDKVSPLMNFIKQNSSRIKRVSLLGGEPLLLKESIDLLDILSPDTVIEIITNLNVNLESNEIYQKLVKRKKVIWYVSMETVGKRFEFVRRGADWDIQVQNLRKLVEDTRSSDSVITMQSQYCVYNALNLTELHDFADTLGSVSVNWNNSFSHPKELDFFKFPIKYKEVALKQVDDCINKYKLIPSKMAHVTVMNLTNLKTKLEQTMTQVNESAVEECVEFHRTQERDYFDNRFDFLELWPQFKIG